MSLSFGTWHQRWLDIININVSHREDDVRVQSFAFRSSSKSSLFDVLHETKGA